MGYPGGRNAYANGTGPDGFFGAKLGTGFGATHTVPLRQMSFNNIVGSPNFKKFARGGAIAGGVMAAATVAGVGLMGFDKFFKKQVGIKSRQGTGEQLLRGAAGGLAVGSVYGLIVTGLAGYQS